jgi:putative ABC transport system permease protein
MSMTHDRTRSTGSSCIPEGGAAATALARSIGSLLFDVTPVDPVTLVSVAGFVPIVAIIAGVIPARRATRIDPAVALRHASRID